MTLRAIEYRRPSTLAEALTLLARLSPPTQPLAGGTYLATSSAEAGALVDLRELPLRDIALQAGRWRIGAMATLEGLASHPDLPQALCRSARHEAPGNLQTMATLGGTIAVGCSGPLLCALLACGAVVEIEPGGQELPLEELVLDPSRKGTRGQLIVCAAFDRERRLGLSEVQRTPEDRPLICLSVGARYNQGKLREVRVACGAYGQPLALLPGVAKALEGRTLPLAPEEAWQAASRAEVAWQDDIRGSSEYRAGMVPLLLKRAADQLIERAPEHPYGVAANSRDPVSG